MKRWWRPRRTEIASLLEKGDPLYVYDDETLNDIFFDAMCLDGVNRFYYTLKTNAHPRIVEKNYSLGGGFACDTSDQWNYLRGLFPQAMGKSLLTLGIGIDLETISQAFQAGASVALDNLSTLQAWPDVLREKDIFLSIEKNPDHPDHEGRPFLSLKNPSGMDFSHVDALARRLKTLGTTVKGFKMAFERLAVTERDPSGADAFLENWFGCFPEASSLILEQGIDPPAHAVAQGDPLPGVKRCLEGLAARFPHVNVRLAMGGEAISHAGILLTPVRCVHDRHGVTHLGIGTGMKILARAALYGHHHEVLNFSRPEGDAPGRAYAVYAETSPDPPFCWFTRMAPVETGDVLLISRIGTYGPMTRLGSDGFEWAPVHYLQARRICQVPI